MLPDKDSSPATPYLSKLAFRLGMLYGVLWLPLLIPLLAFSLNILPHDLFTPSSLGVAALGLFSVWFVKGISGEVGEDAPEGEADFGISFILLGLVSFGITFSLALGVAGTASDSLAIGMLVLLGGLIVLGVAPGVEQNGEWQVGSLVFLGAGGTLGIAMLLGSSTYFLFTFIGGLAFSLSTTIVAHLSLPRLADESSQRPYFWGWLLMHSLLIGVCLWNL
jgi:hypothetical protein